MNTLFRVEISEAETVAGFEDSVERESSETVYLSIFARLIACKAQLIFFTTRRKRPSETLR